MKKITRMTILLLTGLFSLLNVLIWPVNKYEWMLYDTPEMTALPFDPDSRFYSFLAIAPILLLLFLSVIFAKTKNEKKISIVMAALLLMIWLYKFGALFIGAAEPEPSWGAGLWKFVFCFFG